MTIYDQPFYAYDTIDGSLLTENDGVTTDSEGGVSVDWDAQPTVTVDAVDLPPSYSEFFDTDSFKVIDAVVAKPIEQEYLIDGEWFTFRKTEDELRKTAWTVSDSFHTVTHPNAGTVRSTDEVTGFLKDPQYVDDVGLASSLHIPANDDETLEYVSEHKDVSIGFINRLQKTDDDGVDADQIDLLIDHVASVEKGRCSNEDGCGLCDFDPQKPPVVAAMTETDSSEVRIHDNEYDFTKDDNINTMTDSDFILDTNDASVATVRDEHSGVDSLINDKEDTIDELNQKVNELQNDSEALSDVQSVIDADEGDNPSEHIESLQDSLRETEEELNSYREEQIEALTDSIQEMADYSDEELQRPDDRSIEEHKGWLQDKHETIQKVAESNDGATTEGVNDPGSVSAPNVDTDTSPGEKGESEFTVNRDGSVDLMSEVDNAGSNI